jgi:WD40 repeat protein
MPSVGDAITGIASADLARLAFASAPAGPGAAAPRHLVFLPPEALELDLDDPAQRAFGSYELLEKIGQGGMGVVYRARQTTLDREVALKLLAAGPWASEDFIARFRREAQSAARMEHPNIVTVFETGAHEDLHYFSMRLVRGPSLATLLHEDGRLSPRDAARMMRSIAEAVDYAHRLGVLHLDLKPGNILIDGDGEPLVADFGLARRLDQVLGERLDEVSGTPSYMAPEQARGESIGAATDCYGLGCVLFEMLVGEPPFGGGSPQDTLQRVVRDAPPSPRARRPEIPRDLEAICLKCLAKDPAARYASARALGDDLGRWLEGRETSVRPLSFAARTARWMRREPLAAVASVFALVALVTGLLATTQQWRRAEGSAAQARRMLWDGRREAALRLQADGHGFEAVPRLLDNLREQEALGDASDAALDRRRLGVLLGQGAVPIDRMLVADSNPLALATSADGRLLAIGASDQSVRWYDAASLRELGRVSLRGKPTSSGGEAAPRLLRFVDDHRLRVTLDWLSNRASPDDGDTWLVDLASATVEEPPAAFTDFADATYSADGKLALLRDRRWRSQLWQVSPWRALGPRSPPMLQATPWLVVPDGQTLAFLDMPSKLVLFRGRDFSRRQPVLLPGNSDVSAWMASSDGRWLAVGDFEGRVFLLDLREADPARALHALPTPPGREVAWLAFSEDDAWLAAATQDGTAYAFDVASGEPLASGQMQHDFAPRRVGISHRERLLVVAGRGRSALWRLPPPGPRAVPAQRVGLAPTAHALAGDYAMDWSLATGLFASAGVDGAVRLWRLPATGAAQARAAPQVPEQTWFDGIRLPDVAWDRLRLVGVDGRALTPWRALPGPPGFVEVLSGGQGLVATIGARMYGFDARTLAPRFGPLALPASPERFASSADGRRLALVFSEHAAEGWQARVQAYDLDAPSHAPAVARVAGPLRRLQFSHDGTRLLAIGPADGETTVFDARTLAVRASFPHDEFQPVRWADFAREGEDVLLASRAQDPRLGSDSVGWWNPRTDVVRDVVGVARSRPLGVLAAGGNAIVAGVDQDLVAVAGALRPMPRLARGESTAVLALSADGRVLAHAFQREVQLHDAATGVALGAPLAADGDANDTIVQLAFAPDGTRLLARTLQGRWRSWRIAGERRPLPALRQWTEATADAGLPGSARRVVDARERAALRAGDPGAWQAPGPRPAPASITTDAGDVPLRPAGASPLLVDLGRGYTTSPERVHNRFYNVRAQMRPLPAGIQRFDGDDFDVRGLLQFGVKRRDERDATRSHVGCLPLPPLPVSALRLLVQFSVPVPEPGTRTLAQVRLHYADGGEAVLPIRTQHDVPGFSGRDQDVVSVLAVDAGQTVLGFDDPGVQLVTLANPQPQRIVRCFDLDALDPLSPGLLLAVTARPVAPEAATARPPAAVGPGAGRSPAVGATALADDGQR